MPLYMRFQGLEGSVTQAGYEGCIEIDSFSWGFSVAVQTTVGSSGNRMSAGKITPGDVHIAKRHDPTTTDFLLMAMQGKAAKASIIVTMPAPKGKGGQAMPDDKYMEYILSDAICTNYNTSATAGGGQPMESIALNFSEINFAQTLRDKSLALMPTKRGGYDFTKGVAA